ncbi:MAG: PAS domain-containing sensor histidine kinase [Candidatus Terrybacteria bacterium]|nr:PAS domain-containing sensor histidine kinase [Candidatus Terrybacteria bacterium]
MGSKEKGRQGAGASVQLAAAFEQFPEALVLKNIKGQLIFLNREAEEIFKVRRNDVLGKTAAALRSRNQATLRSALMVEIPESGETRFVLPFDSRTRAFAVSEISLPGNGGDMSALRVFRETTREEELSRLKTQFMSITAHQLRTPISGLKWVIEMLLSGEVGKLTESQRELLVRAADTGERMIRLIGDLLDVTRIEEGRFGYHFRVEADIAALVARVVEDLRARAQAKGIALVFMKPRAALPSVKIDVERFGIAVENIVENAITYTMQGNVTVNVELKGDMVAVTVRDTGIGIPKDAQEKISTKFFRAENVVRLGIGGTGLGLFIVHHVMKRHGGDMAVVSEEGKGTTITLTLPVDPARVPEGEVSAEDAVV